MINKFILTAGWFHMLVAGRQSFLFLAAFSLSEQGNVLNLAPTDVHADHETGRRNQHQDG